MEQHPKVKEQGDLVRKLKSAKAPKEEITEAVAKLKELKSAKAPKEEITEAVAKLGLAR